MAARTLWTVGHSTRDWAAFVKLLQAWKIDQVIDVRTVPRSRAFPQFEKSRMKTALPKAGIAYEHLPALGGLRHARKNSPNAGWHNASFRGYADYMQTPEFAEGLKTLNRRRTQRRVAILCSEAVWWRCHRRMIADAELARRIPVRHIMTEKTATPHALTEFARIRRKRGRPPVITYPSPRVEPLT